MKKQVVKYYCDLCKKEISDEKMLIKDLTVLGIRKVKVDENTVRSGIVRVKNQDICSACATKLASLVVVDSNNTISFAQKPKEVTKTTTTTKTVTKSSPIKSDFKTKELPNTKDKVIKQNLKLTKAK